MGFYAGMDIGGSHARMAVADENGCFLCRHEVKGASINALSPQETQAYYDRLVKETLAKPHFLPGDCRGLYAAVSGVDNEELRQACEEIFVAIGFAKNRMTIMNDCQIYLMDVQGAAIVLTVGTGAIAYGQNTDGSRQVRCGGWNHLISDEGSGFHMGLAVLSAVGNHLDGRAQCPALYDLFCQESPLRDPVGIGKEALRNVFNKRKIARYATLVEPAAADGDVVAKRILEDCAKAYFQLVMDTHHKLFLQEDEPFTLLLWGSVISKCIPLTDALKNNVDRALPAAQVCFPSRSALEIALASAVQGGKSICI